MDSLLEETILLQWHPERSSSWDILPSMKSNSPVSLLAMEFLNTEELDHPLVDRDLPSTANIMLQASQDRTTELLHMAIKVPASILKAPANTLKAPANTLNAPANTLKVPPNKLQDPQE